MMIAVAVLALVIIPLTIIQVQNQQNIQQHAWLTTQSASASCPVGAAGVEITVTFTNTEPLDPTLSMDVTALDQQSGKSVDMGSIKGGETKTNKIQTGKATLANGNVVFSLKWTDGHAGTDTRSAIYNAVSNCVPPTPTPTMTPKPTATPTPLPSGVPSPTPTICPTLGPVQNVKIDCPNCP